MRGKAVVILILIIFLASLCSTAYAQNAARKLGRGMANILTGWIEIPGEIGKTAQNKGEIAAIFVAPIVGLCKAAGRTLAGAYDVVTFPIPLPRGYEPLVEPEFVMQGN